MLTMVKEGLDIAFTSCSFVNLKDFKLPPLLKLENTYLYAKLNPVILKNSVKKAAMEQFLQVTKEVIEGLNIEIMKDWV